MDCSAGASTRKPLTTFKAAGVLPMQQGYSTPCGCSSKKATGPGLVVAWITGKYPIPLAAV